MPPRTPLVSIVLVCRDGRPFLEEALSSVERQTYGSWEVLFFDNGSTDGSAELAVARARAGPEDPPRWRIVSSERSIPVGEARNRSVALARGGLVAFLDADDTWRPEKLEMQVGLLDRTGAGLVFSEASVVDANGAVLGRFFERWPPGGGDPHEALIAGNFIPHSTVVARREVLESLGGFDPELRIACDYDFWLRASRVVRIERSDRALATWRVHGRNLTDAFRVSYRENALIYQRLLETARANEDGAYERHVRNALAVLFWKWAFRSLGAGEGASVALSHLREAFRCSGGPFGGLVSGLSFLGRQIRGFRLRLRIEKASRGSPQ